MNERRSERFSLATHRSGGSAHRVVCVQARHRQLDLLASFSLSLDAIDSLCAIVQLTRHASQVVTHRVDYARRDVKSAEHVVNRTSSCRGSSFSVFQSACRWNAQRERVSLDQYPWRYFSPSYSTDKMMLVLSGPQTPGCESNERCSDGAKQPKQR